MLEEYKIIKCEVLDNYNLMLTFKDGKSGLVNVGHLVGKGVFKLWEDYGEFRKIHIDSVSQTVCWNNELDLDPITLRQNIK